MNLICSILKEEHTIEWRALLEKNKFSGFQQSFEWSLFMRKQGWSCFKLGLFEKDSKKIIGGALVFKIKVPERILFIPAGPILNYENRELAKQQWELILKAINIIMSREGPQRFSHLRIEPRLSDLPSFFSNLKKAKKNHFPIYSHILSLDVAEEDLLKGMKSKCRYNISLAKRKELLIESGFSKGRLSEFYDLYLQTMERAKMNPYPVKYFQELFNCCGVFLDLKVAYHQKKAISSVILVKFGKRVTYLYGASSNDKRNLMAPYLLHWESIVEAKQEGFREYDFWGAVGERNRKSTNWEGIHKFKAQFGGRLEEFIGSYDLIFQSELYKKVSRSKYH